MLLSCLLDAASVLSFATHDCDSDQIVVLAAACVLDCLFPCQAGRSEIFFVGVTRWHSGLTLPEARAAGRALLRHTPGDADSDQIVVNVKARKRGTAWLDGRSLSLLSCLLAAASVLSFATHDVSAWTPNSVYPTNSLGCGLRALVQRNCVIARGC